MKQAKWEQVFFECPLANRATKERRGSILVSANKRGAWLFHAEVYQVKEGRILVDVIHSDGPFTVSHSCGLRLCEVKSRTAATKMINKFHKDGYGDTAIALDGTSPTWSDEAARNYFKALATSQKAAQP